ncbi:MAG TPA: cytochrome c [Polyangiaceae bacterium]|nr:cytochrome c [Polyangiaceae bacterium]
MSPRWLPLAALALIGCGGVRASEPVVGPTPLGPEARRGQLVFMRRCNSCHPQGEAGLGMAINDKPLPGTLIKAKVRGLVPGDMPKFGENDIADDDLDALAHYLKTIRKRAK